MPLFGKGRGDGPPRAWVKALETLVEPLPGSRELVDYVLTGREAAALGGLRKGAAWSAITKARHRTPEAVTELYGGFGCVDADVLRRWGRVLEATFNTTWGMTTGPVAGGHWHELMINHARVAAPTGPLPLTFPDLARIAAVDGASESDLLGAAFQLARYSRYQRNAARGHLHRIPGFADALATHPQVVGPALTGGNPEQRLAALAIVGASLSDGALSAYSQQIAEAATTTSAQVRDAARPLLDRLGGTVVEPLRTLATDAKPEQRARSLELLLAMPDQRDWAAETAAADRAGTVRAVVAARAAADGGEPVDDLVLPEQPPLPSWEVPRETAEAVAAQVIAALADAVRRHNDRARAHRLKFPQLPPFQETPAPGPSEATSLARLLAAPEPASRQRFELAVPAHFLAPVAEVIEGEGYPAPIALQVMAALGFFAGEHGAYRRYADVVERLHARTGEPDLLTLQRMLDEVGCDGRQVIWSSYASSWGTRLANDWPDEQVWPFVATHLDWLLASRASESWGHDQHAIFRALATFPTPPARVVDRLYAMALGSRKGDRGPAQAALERDPQRSVRAAAALQDGKGETRIVAAQWLARIADPATLPQLQAAWKKEKQDVIRGALLDALVALGEDAETYLDPRATTATAEKVVAKGMPASLSWLDWDVVPEVTWASSGDPVPRVVVQWLCAVAVKTRSPEPDAVLRQYAALLDVAGRERLAVHLLTAWLREDVRPISAAEAEQRAAQNAASFHRWYSQSPGSPYFGMTVEQLTAAMLPSFARQPAGSATASKGLLSVVAACGGRDVVPPAERFLREWYGQRAAQGKALIGMLAWVEHPSATQLVLSVGSRFRTKSFQDEAVRQAEALAQRKGWTVDELADRTIPTAGFEDDGVLELPYGPRTFSARLQPDLTVELHDSDGRTVKALPTPRQTDDADQAKESKKAFTAAKKELKAIATLQTQRLYEALCTERSWSVEDWQRYLLRHPVVGPAVRRLVWVATTGDDSEPVAFRPLDDGSLTGVDDDEVRLRADGQVRLAHDSLLTADQVQRWVEHLADYEVTPLFEQLGRGVHAVASETRSEHEIGDFSGHVLEAFSLRGRATKLGYTRGQAEDGGWFFTYDKRFPTLGIIATIGFTGNGLPEENRTVALTRLSFRRETEGRSVELTLGDVPAVLVSECWHDMRLIAAEGTGFDPDWQKKTEF
ncbi:MAG TPA: DUF4132 domain-containing protein [Nocardioides sp.]|uniref:DUF4132 domain-containing protein n=1 Tax=Nocardioides sp. TaxID=35761 RepID=UPI002F421519